MAMSPHDLDPESSPDVRCECGSVVEQTIYFPCEACGQRFEVACTPKGFWMWVRITAEPICTHCAAAANRLHWVPGLLHRRCASCGKDEVVQQGI